MEQNRLNITKISIKDYLDFREYLRDYIDFRRNHGDIITNRNFAAAIGLNSSSWLTSVLSGKKGITAKTADSISSFLGHDDWERNYFKTLIKFNQAKTVEKRNNCFSQLKQCLIKKGYYAIQVLDNNQYEYYSKWYHSAVRSILGMVKLGDEYELIARLVSPSITASNAKKSIKLLNKLGLIIKNTDGYYELTNNAITTGTNVRSLAVANFQRETMRLGIDSIDRYNMSTRDISTLSIGISEDSYKKITEMIADLRKSIVEIANNDENANRVYQVNFQVFPISKLLSKEVDDDENE